MEARTARSECKLDSQVLLLRGSLLMMVSLAFGVMNLYSLLVSKVLPETGIALLDWVKNDRFFCLLVPTAIPVILVFVYVHWLLVQSGRLGNNSRHSLTQPSAS
mmetsp:Transcript_4905/g.7653  ORF Transcript_4905/g.7653 Transcript_4905/m.7653 type:complete len:104 (-) Transcript_4905:315-626(-)